MPTKTLYSLDKEDFEKSIHIEVASIDEDDEVEPVQNTPNDSFYKVIRDLVLFESRIRNTFIICNERYQYGCGDTDCNSSCGVPHLTLIVKVRGMPDDRVGIILDTNGGSIERMLPQAPNRRYSDQTWRNSRFYVMRRLFLCLYYHDTFSNMDKDRATRNIIRLMSKPLHVYPFGFVMGKVLDLQK
jgi:hypothetical protein